MNIDELEAAAKTAQDYMRGDWRLVSGALFGKHNLPRRIAPFVAACSPSVVLALIARIRELEEREEDAYLDQRFDDR